MASQSCVHGHCEFNFSSGSLQTLALLSQVERSFENATSTSLYGTKNKRVGRP